MSTLKNSYSLRKDVICMPAKTFALILLGFLLVNLSVAQSVRIKWLVPDELDFDSKGIDTEQSQLDIKVDILVPTGIKIQPGQVKLYRNNIPYLPDGEKLGNAPLKQTSEAEFRLNQKLELLEGRNELKVEVISGNQIIRSKSLIVNYISGKPNLYILCVGVVNDLKYPGKDAESIFNIFRTQSGHLFGKVEGELLVCKDKTSRSYIGDKILNLQQMGLRKQDVLLIFLSGHGQTTTIDGKEDFGFVGSERSQGIINDKYLLLSFKNDIINPIANLPCKRLIFIDACKSGAISGAKGDDFAEIQKQISNTPASIITLSSSSGSESSWENEIWQHGAFTKAMLEGLNGKADANHDTLITVKEIADYIINEVQELVRKINRQQKPQLIKPLEFDYAIFNYQKKNNNQPFLEEDCRYTGDNSIAIIGLKPENLKAFDFQLSNLARTSIEQNQKGEFQFTSPSGVMDIVKKGIPEKLIDGQNPFIPASLNETRYLLILTRKPTTFQQESHSGVQFWTASTTISYYMVATQSKEIIDSGELSVNGADSDKNTAEKRALERSFETLKIKTD